MLPQVRSRAGTPVASDFSSATGTPFVVNTDTGQAWLYANGVPAPLGALNAMALGAKGDGTDDTVKLQAALTAAAGKALFLPEPSVEYKITDEITIPADTRVYGAGWGSKVKQYTRDKNVFILGGNNITVEGVHLVGDNGTTGTNLAKNNGVYGSGVRCARILNCTIEKFENAGIQLRDVTDSQIRGNILFQNPFGADNSCSDIFVYSSSAGGRISITDNHCLSNNSQGIYVSALGNDADIVIANNICVTLDANFAEVASGSVTRRHGIVLAYNGEGQTRLVVNGNVCRNTRWTGIYSNTNIGGPSGPMSIVGNVCSNNGYETGNSLSGGIFLISWSGGVVCANNVIQDFQNTNSLTGGITAAFSSVVDAHTLISGNGIFGSLGKGIALVSDIRNVRITGNYLWGNAGIDIYAAASAANTDVGDVTISENTITRTSGTTVQGIFIDSQAGTNRWVVSKNTLRGNDNTTNDILNTGVSVRFPETCDVVDNTISHFYNGIGTATTMAGATRHFEGFRWDFNRLHDCNTGIVIGAGANTSCLPLEGNVFSSVTTRVGANGGFKMGYIARRDGLKFVLQEGTAAPAVGTWSAGDRIDYDAPASGAAPGAVCTTGGSPGTWKTYAVLA